MDLVCSQQIVVDFKWLSLIAFRIGLSRAKFLDNIG